MVNKTVAGKINVLVLFVSIILIFALPFKKDIWYDESISILCSKGINYDTYSEFRHTSKISSADIKGLNDNGHVFEATVMDNSNSILYNICLHYFTNICGNSLTAYILFSRLWAVAALVAFFFLSRLLLGDNAFVSIALIMLVTDLNFLGMAGEIRPYEMGVFFVILSALYFFRYTLQAASQRHLLLFGLCSTAAILTHFFCAYIIVVFVVALLSAYSRLLFLKRNLLPLLIPIVILASYFFAAKSGLSPKDIHTVVLKNPDAATYSLTEAIHRFMKFSVINFKIIYSRISDSFPLTIFSFLFLICLYFYGVWGVDKKAGPGKFAYHLLFITGISASVFLGLVSVGKHTFSPFYYRYFVFSSPFCAAFLAMFLKIFFQRHAGGRFLNVIVLLIITVPPLVLFVATIRKTSEAAVNYNHPAIAAKVIKDNAGQLSVPSWEDAFLVQSFLPKHHSIAYVLDTTSDNFIIHKQNIEEVIPVIKHY